MATLDLKQLEGKPTPQGTAPVTGRALRAALGSWFLVADVNQVAWKACKARQRATPAKEAFALRDALRIAHRVTLRGDRPYGPARPLDPTE